MVEDEQLPVQARFFEATSSDHKYCRCAYLPFPTTFFYVAVVMRKPGKQAGFQRAAEATGQSQRLVLQARHGFGPQHGAFTGKIIHVPFFRTTGFQATLETFLRRHLDSCAAEIP